MEIQALVASSTSHASCPKLQQRILYLEKRQLAWLVLLARQSSLGGKLFFGAKKSFPPRPPFQKKPGWAVYATDLGHNYPLWASFERGGLGEETFLRPGRKVSSSQKYYSSGVVVEKAE